MTLTAAGPAGTEHDPFAGGVAGPAPEFDGTRFADAGATEEELSYLAYGFDSMTRAEQQRAVSWTTSASDEEFKTAFTRWREQHEQEVEAEQLTDGTVDEVLARVHGDGSIDYARRVLAAEQLVRGDEARKTLVEPLEKMLADHDEAEREAAEQIAALEELTAGTVQDVINRVGSDRELAARTLDAERELKGEDARTTLVAALEKLAAPESAADGSQGSETPPTPETPASDQQDSGAEATEPTA